MTIDITSDRLRSLFRPRAVAFVGASDKSAFSRNAYANMVEFSFDKKTHLVNRRGVDTHGTSTVTSCLHIDEPVDVAFMMVPQAATLEALSDAAAAGIRNAVILSAGYGEAGEAGISAQRQLVEHAASLDMLLLGPNHLGYANLVDQVPVTSIPGLPHQAGPVALLSQSGASSQAMADFASLSGVDLSYMVTLGNEAMITAGHVLDFLVDDENTRAVAIFMETIREPQVFRDAARRAAAAGKAVVVLKAGSSELSARTAAAHTGALVGDDRVVDAIFRDLGVIRVDSIEDMLLTAGAAAYLGRLDRPGIGVVSISGGACDILADRAEDLGAVIPEISDETTETLRDIMPAFGTVQNPLDVTGAAVLDPTIFTRSIEAMSSDPSVGVVAAVNSLPWRPSPKPWAEQWLADAIGAGIARAHRPVVYVNQVSQPITDRTVGVLEQAGVPYVLPGLRQAMVALGNVGWWSDVTRGSTSQRIDRIRGLVDADGRPRRGAWSEDATRRLLGSNGVPFVPATLATSVREAVEAAGGFGGPVAIKVSSPDILHKSDIGGVRLNVLGEGAVAEAYEGVIAAGQQVSGATIEGALISPMRRAGVELLVGVVRDPEWGLMLAVALGGLFVEVLDDSTLAPLPVDPAGAKAMLARLRGAALLSGVRGSEPADLDQISDLISLFGDLALTLGDDLESMEINPLRIDGSTVEALDAVITWTDKEIH
ncbi:acetate--CoA ligase family protein [Gordonia rubripertincta]|uniref:Acetate--CoA ligase family protein n=1 Tax=Gordonia rubripertincta TaxID=36822 RepID=A0ABT4MWN4_GORRU|nr:acetate--CoA ligase family protein [Gordonia rubripertincta]MCZ4551423.1 acetate--CoA ligase family protein [Gordonia rubripertincta]